MERLWIRLGDQGDYEEVGGIDDAGDAIAYAASSGDTAVHSNWRIVGVFGLRGKDELMGIAIKGTSFVGDNYVSVFWSDADAQPTRALTCRELDEFIQSILTADID